MIALNFFIRVIHTVVFLVTKARSVLRRYLSTSLLPLNSGLSHLLSNFFMMIVQELSSLVDTLEI